MSDFGDYLAKTGTAVADTVLERVPLLQIPAAMAGYETEAARERREVRDFRKLEREHAIKRMAHYDEDRRANLARQAMYDKHNQTMFPLQEKIAGNNAEVSELNKLNAVQRHVDTSTKKEYDELFRKSSILTQNMISGFGGKMNQAQQTELYNSPIGQEFRDFMVFADHINSTNPNFRRIAQKTANKLGIKLSDDGKNVILKDGKTVPFDDNFKNYLREGYAKQLADNAASIVKRDDARNYIDGYTRWNFIDQLAGAMNHPTNNNKGNLAYAEQTFDNLLKGFTDTERSQFMIYGSIKNFLSDGIFSPDEQAKYGDQLAYWAQGFGIKYRIDEGGKVKVISSDGKEHDGKEYFDKAFASHPITNAFNTTLERIKKQNTRSDEQSALKQKMAQYYRDADMVNDLRMRKIEDKEKQKVRNAWAESMLFYDDLKERYPNDIDNNILRARQYFRNEVGSNYISPFDADADEIELELSQRSLSSWDDKVIKQTSVASRSKNPSDLERAAYGTMGRAIPNNQEKQHKELARLIKQRNNAQARVEENKARFEKSKKRNLSRFRKLNSK